MMFTGLGPGDALSLPKEALQNGAVRTRRAKTGTYVYWPVIRQLQEILDNAPPHEASTLVASKIGRSWTVDGFRASWNKFRIDLERRELIAPGLTLYGLRHTVATILRETGMDDRSIADALAQTTETMARHYSWRADITQKMGHIASVFEGEIERRQQKVSNRSEKSVKPERSKKHATEKHQQFQEEEWCPEAESNHRHADFQSAALPTELSGRALIWEEAGPVRRKPGPYRSSFAPCPAPRQSFFTTCKNANG